MPNFEKPETVWPTNEYVWLSGGPEAHKRAIRQRVSSGKEHLYRQVGIANPGYPAPYSTDDISNILDEAESEFAHLGRHGIRVPDIRWRILDVDHRRPRVMAKIDIIEGITPAYVSEEADFIRGVMQQYFDPNRPGRRLFDIDSCAQYIVGSPRATDQETPTVPGIYLVDIEPKMH